MKKNKKIPDNQIAVYQTPDGKINIEVLYANENIWLPQRRMAELFGCSADNISLHLKNIYKEKELDELSTAEVFSVVQIEGKREVTRSVTCYSLEAIIAVGFRDVLQIISFSCLCCFCAVAKKRPYGIEASRRKPRGMRSLLQFNIDSSQAFSYIGNYALL